MALIHQTIPAQHIPALLQNGHHFTPCRHFRDRMEFYYGYCLFNYAMISEEDIEKCVQHATQNEQISKLAGSACVSCWVSDLRDESRMWKEHGGGNAAIRISIDADRFCEHVKNQGHSIVYNHVTYEDQISMIHPGRHFLARANLTNIEDPIYHFFFHKRGHYDWEREFRVIVFSTDAISIPLVPEIIESIIVSPLGKLDLNLRRSLQNQFDNRVRDL